MGKLRIISILGALSATAVATDNTGFQQFQNEYNIAYGYQSGSLVNGVGGTSSFNAQSINLEVERLFNNRIWIDGNFNMVTNYSQPNLGTLNGGNGSGMAYGQDPFMFSLTGKFGYAFQIVNNTLQLTPYVMGGRTNNWSASTVIANGGQNMSNDYFYTGGLGGRISYKINPTILVYADELYTYNWDNSGAVKTIQTSTYGKSYAATNYEFTSTIGAKFNVWRQLQLGSNIFWTNYQPQSNISGYMYTPENIVGGEVSVGLTY